jgi:hypothetical protein
MIWADAILSFRKHNPSISDWKFKLFIYVTWMQALNAWIIFLWLKYFGIFQIPLININFFPGEILDEFIAFTVEFALPFGLLNYFLIFYKNRHKKITEKYSNLKYKYALTYSFVMILGAFVSAILYSILT